MAGPAAWLTRSLRGSGVGLAAQGDLHFFHGLFVQGVNEPHTNEPRPNYWLAVLWNRLMGTTAFATGEPVREGAHLYAHSRRDGQSGAVYLLVNNSREATEVELPAPAQRYTLSAPQLRAPVMELNGRPLVLEDGALPALEPEQVPAGTAFAAPHTVTFFVLGQDEPTL